MNAAATYDINREYHVTFYNAWLKHRSRWRRFAIPIALLFLVAAGIAFRITPMDRSIRIALVLVAMYNAADALSHRWRWIRDRVRTQTDDKRIHFVFRDNDVAIKTPNSEGTIRYDGFTNVAIADNGIFLVPQTGLSVFVPSDAFNSTSDFDDVVEMLRTRYNA